MQWCIALFWAIMIAVLHAIPGQDLAFIQMDDLSYFDKIFHLGVFAIGAWLLMRIKTTICDACFSLYFYSVCFTDFY